MGSRSEQRCFKSIIRITIEPMDTIVQDNVGTTALVEEAYNSLQGDRPLAAGCKDLLLGPALEDIKIDYLSLDGLFLCVVRCWVDIDLSLSTDVAQSARTKLMSGSAVHMGFVHQQLSCRRQQPAQLLLQLNCRLKPIWPSSRISV